MSSSPMARKANEDYMESAKAWGYSRQSQEFDLTTSIL